MQHTCHAKLLQSCLILRDPMDCSHSGSSVHGIFQARLRALLQEIFPTQGSNLSLLCLPYWHAGLLWKGHLGSPKTAQNGTCVCLGCHPSSPLNTKDHTIWPSSSWPTYFRDSFCILHKIQLAFASSMIWPCRLPTHPQPVFLQCTGTPVPWL